jgi:hypothetical protein
VQGLRASNRGRNIPVLGNIPEIGDAMTCSGCGAEAYERIPFAFEIVT